jgi:hypothetical protein
MLSVNLLSIIFLSIVKLILAFFDMVNIIRLSVVRLSVTFFVMLRDIVQIFAYLYCYEECRYAESCCTECRYAECFLC